MIDGAGPSRARRSLAATSTERQELAGIAEAEHRVARPLIRLDPKAKQLLVKLIGTRSVGTRVGAMTPVSESDQASLRRRLGPRANVAERTGPTAIPRILQLNDDAVRIAKVELRSAFFASTSFRAAHTHAHSHGLCRFAFGDATLGQNGLEPIDVKIVNGQTNVIDLRRI